MDQSDECRPLRFGGLTQSLAKFRPGAAQKVPGLFMHGQKGFSRAAQMHKRPINYRAATSHDNLALLFHTMLRRIP